MKVKKYLYRLLYFKVLIFYCHTSLAVQNTTEIDTSKINRLLLSIEKLSNGKNSDSVIYYSKQTYDHLRKIKAQKGNSRSINLFLIRSYISLAENVKNTKDLINVERYLFEALSLAKSKKFLTEECLIVGKLGLYYYSEGDYPSALNYSFQNLKLAEKLMDKKQIAIANNRIGIVFKRQMEHAKAIDYIEKSVKLFEELGDRGRAANSINNIGDVYFNQKKFKQALINYNKELKIGLKIKEPDCIADAYNCIGLVYYSIIDLPKDSLEIILGIHRSALTKSMLLDSAAIYMEKAKSMYLKLNDTYEISDCLNGIGKIHQLRGRNNDAIKSYSEAFSMANEFGYMEKQKQAAFGLYENYHFLKQPEQSLKWYISYSQINDSIFNISKAKDLGRLESRHEFEAKEKLMLANQKHERELANADKKQQRFIIIIVSISLVIVVSLFIYLLTRFRLIKHQNQLIDMQRKMMWEKQKEIIDSIKYAKRIQQAQLPTQKYLDKHLKKKN